MRIALTFAIALSSAAVADPRVVVEPAAAKPGEAILVTVIGVDARPRGDVATTPLHFFPARRGYQAVFAIPLDATPGTLAIKIDRATSHVTVRATAFPSHSIEVADAYANPDAEARARIDRDNHRILAAMATSDDTPPTFTRAFDRPDGTVTSTFGEWRTFNGGPASQHLGLDVRARRDAPVRAINDGTVTLVTDAFVEGTVVVISHGGGIASGYFHLSSATVAEGDTIQRGDTIGRAGSTGRATGPHLHVAVRVPGGLVDPTTFFHLPIAPAPTVMATR